MKQYELGAEGHAGYHEPAPQTCRGPHGHDRGFGILDKGGDRRPLNDLHAVFATKHDHQPSWNSENFGRHSVDCLEIFAGHGKISGAFANKRRGVLQPRDLLLGHDLRDESQRDEVFREIYTHRPKMIWLAPPCTNWCAFSRLNHDSQEQRRRRRREKELIKLVEEVIVFQRANYGLVVVENPRTSDIWRYSALSRWYHDSEMHLCQVDLCTYGLESREGIPMRKGLTLLYNSSEFAEDLTRRCDGDMNIRGFKVRRRPGLQSTRTNSPRRLCEPSMDDATAPRLGCGATTTTSSGEPL